MALTSYQSPSVYFIRDVAVREDSTPDARCSTRHRSGPKYNSLPAASSEIVRESRMAEVSMALLLFVMLTLRWLATVAAVVVGVWIAQRMAAPHSSFGLPRGAVPPRFVNRWLRLRCSPLMEVRP